MGKKILEIIKYCLQPFALFLKHVWRFLDYETYPHMYMEREDYQKDMNDFMDKKKKEREEKESKIFEDKIMEQ